MNIEGFGNATSSPPPHRFEGGETDDDEDSRILRMRESSLLFSFAGITSSAIMYLYDKQLTKHQLLEL